MSKKVITFSNFNTYTVNHRLLLQLFWPKPKIDINIDSCRITKIWHTGYGIDSKMENETYKGFGIEMTVIFFRFLFHFCPWKVKDKMPV